VVPTHPQRRYKRAGRSFLAVAVFPSASTAFMAYRLLHYHGISPEHLAIVGDGYSKPEWVGLLEPRQVTRKNSQLCAFLGCLVGSTIGFASAGLFHGSYGVALPLAIAITAPVAALIGGIVGVLTGFALSFFGEGSRMSIYHHHLTQGHYLLMIEGSESIVQTSRNVLGQYSSPKEKSKSR
jgi:hypothetical protein